MSRALYGVGPGIGGYTFTPSVIPGLEAFTIFRPRVRPAYGSKGVIFLIHGAGGSAAAAGSGGVYEGLQNYLANALGFTVLAADFGSNGNQGATTTAPDTWANNVAMAAMDAAFKWATGGPTSGTLTAVSATTLTDTLQNWRPNMWSGHALTSNGKTAIVATNSATVLTLTAAGWTGGTPAGGSTYAITPHYSDIPPAGKSTKVGIVGVSMGAWEGRNWASRNTAKVAFIVDIAGVVDGSFQFSVGSGAGMDLAYGPAAPTAAPSTPTGTAGAVAYTYKSVEVAAIGDGPPSAATASANLAAQANLNTTPNTVAGITHPAYNSSGQPITGTRILRSVAAAAYTSIDVVGHTTIATATGTGATTSLTVAALPFAIPINTVVQLSHPSVAEGGTDAGVGTTQNVTVSVAAAAAATTLTVTSFTPASGGGTAAWQIGTKVKPVTYVDAITAGGSAYTQIAAGGTSVTTGPYGVNGAGANPSYNPLAATNLTAGLKAIPLQYWWSANDGGTSTGSGVPGTVNTEVQKFETAYGGNLTLQEIPGDPVHNNTISTVGLSAPSLAILGAFINANQP